MVNGKNDRILPLLSAILLLLILSLSFVFFLLRVPDKEKLPESLLSAEMAIAANQEILASRSLLRASRYAVSVDHWMQILQLSARLLPEEPRNRDYRLFEILSLRAISAVPGNQDFIAFLAWAAMRSGDLKKAQKLSEKLTTRKWSSLRGEINLNQLLSSQSKNLKEFSLELQMHTDADFFDYVAELTESAELTLDASLAHMQTRNKSRAFELAQLLVNNNRRWNKNRNLQGIIGGLARIAYDAGKEEEAVAWLETGLKEARNRRTVIWEDLQFLGDIYWDIYRLQGNTENREKARDLWYEALKIISETSSTDIPENSWILWVNLSTLEKIAGNTRQSQSLLRSALEFFPKKSEVKAAWARRNMRTNPNVARRLVTNKADTTLDPILEIASLQVDPQSISPRSYEAKLWKLFNEVLRGSKDIHPVDIRIITTFLLEYMAYQKQYSSLDIAIERYRRIYPEDSWILSWRLASDASRNVALINLIAENMQTESFYDEFRRYAWETKNWRALHDVALFGLLATREVKSLVFDARKDQADTDMNFMEPALLSGLENIMKSSRKMDSTLKDRWNELKKNRSDTEENRKLLENRGRKGLSYQSIATATLIQKIETMYSNALKDIRLTLDSPNLLADEKNRLYFLYIAILQEAGYRQEAEDMIEQMPKTNPNSLSIQSLRRNKEKN